MNHFRNPVAVAGLALISSFTLAGTNSLAEGIYRNGVGARAMAMGGADVAVASDALGAMAANPAGLGFIKAPELSLSANLMSVYGNFAKAPVSYSSVDSTPGIFPDAAYVKPLGSSPFTFGISFTTDSALRAQWNYIDPLSAGGISYGQQRERSQITAFRSAVGLGVKLSDQLSLGITAGLDYNENKLQMPYIFQQTPGLVGAKTLLNLQTAGVGWNTQVGLLYRPIEELQFGFSYKSPTVINSRGDAYGDASVQVPGLPPFHYDAQVSNVLPQMVTVGGSWKPAERWLLSLQMDWVNWSESYTRLPVALKNGNSGGLPVALDDYILLNWRNAFVYRAGVEYAATTNLFLRAGYSYGQNPSPDDTLTPLTAAIMENTFTTGFGYQKGRYRIDFAYQWDIPNQRNVGTSSLQAGEFNNSSVKIGIHTFALTTSVKF